MSRCLKTYDTITIVGMDKAIADVVSLVTILQHRGIGEHEGEFFDHVYCWRCSCPLTKELHAYLEVETFTVEQDVRRYTSCIQVKVSRA